MIKLYKQFDAHKSLYSILWSDDDKKEVYKFGYLNKLFNVAFEKICAEQLGLVSKNNNKVETLWVRDELHYNSDSERNNFLEYVIKYYNIIGVSFKKQSQAETFFDFLEKQIIWQELKK